MISAWAMLVLAFGSPSDFEAPATLGGGSGLRFTGSPRERWDCSVCHVTRAPSGLVLESKGRDLVTEGYVPGEVYELELRSEAPGKRNAFALELANKNGGLAGTLSTAEASDDPTPYTCAGVDPVVVFEGRVAQSYACAVSRWRIRWAAPAEDVGPVTLYATAVNANADSRASGDVTNVLLLGVPSPNAPRPRAGGCTHAPAVSVAMFALLLAGVSRRRKGLAVAVALVVSVGATWAAPRKHRAPTPQPVESVAPEPSPPAAVEEPPAAVTVPVAAPPAAAVVPAAEAPQPVVEPAVEPMAASPGLSLEAGAGVGFRSFSFTSASYATAFRVGFNSLFAAVSATVYPLRLARAGALEGLHASFGYATGLGLGGLGLGSARALPSLGQGALGYRIPIGSWSVSPRATYSALIGGVERNALFDDATFHAVGGEVVVTGEWNRVAVELAPRAAYVFDTGEQSVIAYGRSQGGSTFGGTARVRIKLTRDFSLSLAYQVLVTRAALAGRGARDLAPVVLQDLTQSVSLSPTWAR